MSTNQEIAQIIASQIGNRAFTMIGAKHLMAIERGLQFRVGGNAKRVSWIQVILDPMDTYTFRTLGAKGQVKNEVTGVYADMLLDLIETYTGMYTSL